MNMKFQSSEASAILRSLHKSDGSSCIIGFKEKCTNEKISLMKNLKTTAKIILSSVGDIVDG